MFRPHISKLILSLCVGLYFFHFFFIWRYAVNIPFGDEWETFSSDQLPAGFSLRWLLTQHNEHRLVTTKLLVWLLFRLNGWNLIVHQLLNFVIYGIILVWIIWFIRRAAPQTPAYVPLSFMIFLLSPISIGNHVMGYQSQVHFWLLFFLISSYLLFLPSQTLTAIAAGCAASALSIYSLAGGFVSSLILLIAYSLFKCIRAYSAADRAGRIRELLQLALVVTLMSSMLGLWLVGYDAPALHSSLSVITSAQFWDFYLSIIAYSFGVDKLSRTAGVICLLIVLAPICGQILSRGWVLSSAQWVTFSSMIGMLAVLASVAAGRAEFGTLYSKSSRYAEFGMTLIPFSMLAWSFLLRHKKRLKPALMVGLWIFCFVTFLNDWKFRNYRVEYYQRIAGVECVRNYYRQGGVPACSTIYPPVWQGSLADRLENAKKLNASFYRELMINDRDEKK